MSDKPNTGDRMALAAEAKRLANDLAGTRVKNISRRQELHALIDAIAASPLQAAGAAEPVPNDWKLPADLKAGHVTFRKGVHCSALVTRMEYLHEAAFGKDTLTAEQKAENLAALQSGKPMPHHFERPQPAPAGDWISAEDVRRNVRALDAALNGEAGAAQQAALCDIVGQVEGEVRRRGHPLLAAPAGDAGALAEWRHAVEKLNYLPSFLAGYKQSDACIRNSMQEQVAGWIDGIKELYRLYDAAQGEPK